MCCSESTIDGFASNWSFLCKYKSSNMCSADEHELCEIPTSAFVAMHSYLRLQLFSSPHWIRAFVRCFCATFKFRFVFDFVHFISNSTVSIIIVVLNCVGVRLQQILVCKKYDVNKTKNATIQQQPLFGMRALDMEFQPQKHRMDQTSNNNKFAYKWKDFRQIHNVILIIIISLYTACAPNGYIASEMEEIAARRATHA